MQFKFTLVSLFAALTIAAPSLDGLDKRCTANYKVCSSASDCCSGVCEGQMEVGTVCKPASAKVKRCTANYKVCSSASDCCSGKCEGQMEVGTVCKP
ncbi:hypothetical protein HDK90DRAFT_512660 [Phyllosticta capitalensis]|uniref:Uncharacterized protein n=1 Tax=Phyllosticta capitalensis TaxID=121624 RepID=A0ABR1YHY6_9PEZI